MDSTLKSHQQVQYGSMSELDTNWMLFLFYTNNLDQSLDSLLASYHNRERLGREQIRVRTSVYSVL